MVVCLHLVCVSAFAVVPPTHDEDIEGIDTLTTEEKNLSVHPTFQGGDRNTFGKWVYERLYYINNPDLNTLSGNLMASFTIGKDGYVKNVKVIMKSHPLLDAEVIRVISTSPKWTPGLDQDGNPVEVTYGFPVKFRATRKKNDMDKYTVY